MGEDKENKPEVSRDAALQGLADSLAILADQLKNSATPKTKSWLPDWANSPFIVTVIGGLLLSFATFLFQAFQLHHDKQVADRAAIIEKQRQKFQREYDIRNQVMLNFINQYPAAAHRLYEYMYCYAWLKENTNSKAVHPSGRSYTQMWQHLEELDNNRLNSVMASSFPQQINSVFTNITVLALASNLDSQLDDVFSATNSRMVGKYYENLSPTYGHLATAMGGEIKEMQQNETYDITN